MPNNEGFDRKTIDPYPKGDTPIGYGSSSKRKKSVNGVTSNLTEEQKKADERSRKRWEAKRKKEAEAKAAAEALAKKRALIKDLHN